MFCGGATTPAHSRESGNPVRFAYAEADPCLPASICIKAWIPASAGMSGWNVIIPTNQILSGNLMMKLPRFGNFTLGSVCASMVSFSPMNLLSANT